MGSPLGSLLANVFMSSLEEKLELEGKLPAYYRRYVDDTLTVMPDITTATDFLNTFNHTHPAVSFGPFQILLGNFLATFRILRTFFVREQFLATFRKTSTFLVTFGLF